MHAWVFYWGGAEFSVCLLVVGVDMNSDPFVFGSTFVKYEFGFWKDSKVRARTSSILKFGKLFEPGVLEPRLRHSKLNSELPELPKKD